MIKIALALLLLLLSVMPAPTQGPPPVACAFGFSSTSVTGPLATTQIIAAQASHRIYLCGWNLANTGGAASTVSFISGSGANCATNPLTVFSVTIGNGQQNIDHPGAAVGGSRTGDALCWSITGTGTIQGTLYFGQYPAN